MAETSDYPGLYPPVQPLLSKIEQERIIYEGINAAKELQEHREGSEVFSKGVLDGTVDTSASAPSLTSVEIDAILDDEEEDDVEKTMLPLYEPSLLAKLFRSLASRFSTGSKVTVIAFSNGRGTVDEFVAGKPSRHAAGWQGLVGDKANTEKLRQSGLYNVTAAQLTEKGLDMNSLRMMKYEVTQMRNLFTTFEALQAAGFQAHHLCRCCWKLGDFAIAYNINPIQLAARLELTGQQLLRAGVTSNMLHHYNLSLDKELETTHLFDLAWKVGLPALKFCEAFNTTANALFSTDDDLNPKKLTVRQLSALAHSIPGWYLMDLSACGLEDKVAVSAGLGLRSINHKK